MAARNFLAHQGLRGRSERDEHDDDVGKREKLWQLINAVHALPRSTADSGDPSAERCEALLDRCPDRSVPDDEHVAAGQLASPAPRLPPACGLRKDKQALRL